MQSLDLVGQDKIPQHGARFLKADELFYLRLDSLNTLSDGEMLLIREILKFTSELYLSLPSSDLNDLNLIKHYLNSGVKGIALRVSHNVEKWLHHQGIGSANSGDRDLIHLFETTKREIPEGKNIVFEFQVDNDFRVLGPTIAGLYESGLAWAVLNTEEEPRRDMCLKFSELFEYLKIRSCNKLNLYFPLWSKNFREWDIKTQNTFSGLEFVHIDISNRCTHSCVFCGLYGPDAQDDIKKRSGGKIPEVLSNHMKMEIDAEKCLGIIKSLPWSVKSIQFGGFGDPLMHDHAIDFISAARRRGFKVEVLSNMEYLDEKDLNELHSLGGVWDSDLHFFANISGGNAEQYIKTRPKQTQKNFDKITRNLKTLSALRRSNNGIGVHFTIMCVVNKLNCYELEELSKYAIETGASSVWFKPLEIHSDVHKLYTPDLNKMKVMAQSLKNAIQIAENGGVRIFQKEYCQEILNRYDKETLNV